MFYLINKIKIYRVASGVTKSNLRNVSTFPTQNWVPPAFKRWFCHIVTAEDKLKSQLESSFPGAKSVDVVDVSGGCGAMYEIYIEAPQFKGLSIVKQHKLVTEALKEQIKDMHGLRISTTPT